MSNNSEHVLLTEQEAAEILQPLMHNKSALHWLENDRLHEPVIPFHLLQGQPYYLELDLLNFVTHTLNPAARFYRMGHHLHADRRSGTDRRTHVHRRMNVEVELSLGIERRQLGKHDRRLGGGTERRAKTARAA